MALDMCFTDTSDMLFTDTSDMLFTDLCGDVLSPNFMRSMRMPIEYESILEDVSPNDDNDLANSGMLYIGTGAPTNSGDVKVTSIKGDTVTLKNVPSGTWLNFCRVKKVFETGTAATDIVLAR